MNYLAHLFLAQKTAESHFGNLLGDFGGARYAKQYSLAVQHGVQNHYLVDKFTDNHPIIKETKAYFARQRRRFSGIAIDVLFDHYLIQHWQTFNAQPLAEFKVESYQLLHESMPLMPNKMQHVIRRMVSNDWFKEYETLPGVGLALDNIAKRIRFKNEFSGSIEDIERHYDILEKAFLAFFPLLIDHVKFHRLETS